MALLKRQQILDANDMKTEIVSVPEWGGDVCIKMMTGTERDAFEAATIKQNKNGSQSRNFDNVRARFLVKVIIDPDDNNLPVFTESDIKALGAKSVAALDRVFSAAQELNSVTDQDVENLANSFEVAPSESSTSA